jgi:DNA repair exonuclease SbcCD ATPase subunit
MTESLAIPDWLANVPRSELWRLVERFQAYKPGTDAADVYVRLADVAAAAQALIAKEQQWTDDFRAIAQEQRARAEAAEAERDALKAECRALTALVSQDISAGMTQILGGADRQAAQAAHTQIRNLEQERDALRADAQEAIRNGELQVSRSPDLTALRAVLAQLDQTRLGSDYQAAVQGVLDAVRTICGGEQP